jgi:hypothetical protein
MKNKSKSQVLAEEYGYNESIQLCLDFMFSSLVPAICMNERCNQIEEYEPDQDRGWCRNCNTNTVKSILIIEGVI